MPYDDDTTIESLKHLFSTRTHWALSYTEGLNTVGEVRAASDGVLLRIPNFGRRSLNEVRNILGTDIAPAPSDLREQVATLRKLADSLRLAVDHLEELIR